MFPDFNPPDNINYMLLTLKNYETNTKIILYLKMNVTI